ncbi:hypothetical protein M1247_19560 [Mycobacterium sp. 21AC1]|uniref:hypothetical protein n=1 Tax=[Mycobacterium] appelbergii TaxID=2939269 RepID=UPI00293912F3|nr:hypothetical protein [Mycobacterium sp. 21AC1]MDV3127131.1 hypothetical protein [Mycobacterium sp. 21AC1]
MTNWPGGEGYGGPSPIGNPGGQGGTNPPGGWGASQPAPQQPPTWGPPHQQQPPEWGQQGQPGWPQQPPPPFGPQFGGGAPPPGGPRRNRKALFVTIGAGAAVLLVIVLIAVFALAGRGEGGGSSDSAGATVQGYLEALAKGDAEEALSFGSDQPASKELLTDEILKSQIEKMPISNIRILGDDSSNGIGYAQVHVTANFGDQVSDTTFMMKKAGNKWKLDSAAVRLDFSRQGTNKAAGTMTAFGKPVGKSVAYVFPGYVEWGSNNKNLSVDGKPILLDSLTGYSGLSTTPKFDLSDSAHAAIVASVKGRLDECARSRALSPPGCPQHLFEYGAVDGTVEWQAPNADDAQITFSDYSMSARVTMSGSFGYSVQGRDGARVTGSDTATIYGDADLNQTPPTIAWS